MVVVFYNFFWFLYFCVIVNDSEYVNVCIVIVKYF